MTSDFFLKKKNSSFSFQWNLSFYLYFFFFLFIFSTCFSFIFLAFNETRVSICNFSFIFSFFPHVFLSFFFLSQLFFTTCLFFCEMIILLFHTHPLKQEQQNFIFKNNFIQWWEKRNVNILILIFKNSLVNLAYKCL
jgi:hypothetical protein